MNLTAPVLFLSSRGLIALGYIAATTLRLQRALVRKLLSAFAPAGRRALANYLARTVICMTIFYGGGLIGHIGPARIVGIAFLIFPVQMLYSRWWLARYRFGPMEWLWRSLTYGQMQPMRRPAGEQQGAAPVLAG